MDYQRKDDTKMNQFDLKNGNAWVEVSAMKSEVFVLKNFQLMSSSDDSVILLTQNAVSSSVAVLQGKVSLSTNVSSLTIGAGDMVTLFAQDNERADLSDRIQPISQRVDDFIQAIALRSNSSSGATLNADDSIVLSNTGVSNSGSVVF